MYIVGIYKTLTDTWMGKLGLLPHNFFYGNICFQFLVLVLCSVWFELLNLFRLLVKIWNPLGIMFSLTWSKKKLQDTPGSPMKEGSLSLHFNCLYYYKVYLWKIYAHYGIFLIASLLNAGQRWNFKSFCVCIFVTWVPVTLGGAHKIIKRKNGK